jgi:hypothetical protein
MSGGGSPSVLAVPTWAMPGLSTTRAGPFSLNGAAHPIAWDAPAAGRDPGASTGLAGLMARARPEARAKTRGRTSQR